MNDADTKKIYQNYLDLWGTQHPDKKITLDDFRVRLAAFESVIDPWITGEGSKEGAVRKFSKALGVKTYVGRMVFRVMFDAVDQVHPVT